jgi:hypothetical protein
MGCVPELAAPGDTQLGVLGFVVGVCVEQGLHSSGECCAVNMVFTDRELLCALTRPGLLRSMLCELPVQCLIWSSVILSTCAHASKPIC